MSSPARQTRTAWIALSAVLFFSLSSALAVLQSHDRGDFIGEICSAAGITPAAASGESPATPDKAGHDVYCALCRNGATQQAAVAPAITLLFAQVAGLQAMPHVATAAPSADSLRLPPPRAPPEAF